MAYRYDIEKDKKLKTERGFGFDDLFNEGEYIETTDNPSSNHKNQKRFVIRYKGKIYSIPFVVEKNGTYFLKTAYRNSKLDKYYK